MQLIEGTYTREMLPTQFPPRLAPSVESVASFELAKSLISVQPDGQIELLDDREYSTQLQRELTLFAGGQLEDPKRLPAD